MQAFQILNKIAEETNVSCIPVWLWYLIQVSLVFTVSILFSSVPTRSADWSHYSRVWGLISWESWLYPSIHLIVSVGVYCYLTCNLLIEQWSILHSKRFELLVLYKKQWPFHHLCSCIRFGLVFLCIITCCLFEGSGTHICTFNTATTMSSSIHLLEEINVRTKWRDSSSTHISV